MIYEIVGRTHALQDESARVVVAFTLYMPTQFCATIGNGPRP